MVKKNSGSHWAHSGSAVVFGDGACSGNPGPGGWGAVIATADGEVEELGGYEPQTTNNRMELMAVIRAMERMRDQKTPVSFFLDSTYVIRGITQWIWAWRKREWKTAEGEPVAHADLWRKLMSLVAERKKHEGPAGKIEWHYVRGHTGVAGNERVDEIATGFTARRHVNLYSGPLLKYSVAIYDIPENTELPEPRPESARAAKKEAYSYLSLVNGITERHSDWRSCEARVKGRPGAKFKKALTPVHETEILGEWGVDPKDVASSG